VPAVIGGSDAGTGRGGEGEGCTRGRWIKEDH
jgi:hypothetical protein